MTSPLNTAQENADIEAVLAELHPEINGAMKLEIIEGIRTRCSRILAHFPESTIDISRQIELELKHRASQEHFQGLYSGYTSLFVRFGGTPLTFAEFTQAILDDELKFRTIGSKANGITSFLGRVQHLQTLKIRRGDLFITSSSHGKIYTVRELTPYAKILVDGQEETISPFRITIPS